MKIILILLAAALVTGVYAAEQTFTNNATILVAVSDQTLEELKSYRKSIGETNLTIQQMGKTNASVMIGILSPEAKKIITRRKAYIIKRIQEADEELLGRIEDVE